jgi:hypothetical protein
MHKNLIIAFLFGVIITQSAHAIDFGWKEKIDIAITLLKHIDQTLTEMHNKKMKL